MDFLWQALHKLSSWCTPPGRPELSTLHNCACSESGGCGMPSGGHSTSLPDPCPLCVDVTSVTECGTSLLLCNEVHCQ